MSMNATDEVVRSSATLLATVDLPDPEPPAIPMIKGLSIRKQNYVPGVWNAVCGLCFTDSSGNDYESPRSRGFNRIAGGGVHWIQTGIDGDRSESADDCPSRQSGLPGYGRICSAQLRTRSFGNCDR